MQTIVTRKPLANGKWSYGLNVNGQTANLVMESRVLYTHASVYASNQNPLGVTVAFHKTAKAADKGCSDMRYLPRLGTVEIEAPRTRPADPCEACGADRGDGYCQECPDDPDRF